MKLRTLLGPLVVMALMFCASAAAVVMKPSHRTLDTKAISKLDEVIPKSFGAWKIDPSIVPLQVAPDVQAKLDSVYSDVLSRTYVDAKGRRVMLSIAYGGEQSKDLQVHRPEVCYAAQGFSITFAAKSLLEVKPWSVPIKRLVAVQGKRNEPITYWIRVGDDLVLSKLEQGIARLKYGLSGVIPDGILVRVSSIGVDSDEQYLVQDEFVGELLAALPPDARGHLIGSATARHERPE